MPPRKEAEPPNPTKGELAKVHWGKQLCRAARQSGRCSPPQSRIRKMRKKGRHGEFSSHRLQAIACLVGPTPKGLSIFRNGKCHVWELWGFWGLGISRRRNWCHCPLGTLEQSGRKFLLLSRRTQVPRQTQTRDGVRSLGQWVSLKAPVSGGCESGTWLWEKCGQECRTVHVGFWRKGHWGLSHGRGSAPPKGCRASPQGSKRPLPFQSRSPWCSESRGSHRLGSRVCLTKHHLLPWLCVYLLDFPVWAGFCRRHETSHYFQIHLLWNTRPSFPIIGPSGTQHKGPRSASYPFIQ